MADIPSLVDRHDRWRGESCLNLQPSENLVSPQVKRALGSDLAGRYTLPWKAEYHGAHLENAYGGTRYLDEIEAAGEALARKLFDARNASLKPLSGHIAAVLLLLSTCRKRDRVLIVDSKHGGYDGYMPEYIPSLLGLDLKVDFLPFREDAGRVDPAKAAKKIRTAKPTLVVLGASFLAFPYEVPPLREAADEVDALIGYDGSHVLGLVAGGVFQRPLPEGADILVGSTHKSLFGPQGGLFLTNRDDLFDRAKENMLWRLFDNAHWNRIAGVAQALAETQEFGGSYAPQVVKNAKALARALDERGLPVKFKEFGYTESHQVHLDEAGMKHGLRMTPQEFSSAMERNNLIVDAVGRLGTNEITRLGATERDMGDVADLMALVVAGKSVKEEVLAFRSRLKLSYAFPG
jgi:glycine hydroxymethyltransferase